MYVYFCSFLTFVDYLNYPAKSLKNIKETFVLSSLHWSSSKWNQEVKNFPLGKQETVRFIYKWSRNPPKVWANFTQRRSKFRFTCSTPILFFYSVEALITLVNTHSINLRASGTNSLFIIQLCFLEYKYRAKRVQITDICTRLIPPGRVKFKTLASQNFGKRNCRIINLLLDVLVCSIAVYFNSLFVFWLALRARQNTAQLVKIYSDTTHQSV